MKIINICILFFFAWEAAIAKDDTDTTQPIFPQQLTARDLLTYCSSSSLTDLGRQRQRYCWGFRNYPSYAASIRTARAFACTWKKSVGQLSAHAKRAYVGYNVQRTN